MYRKLDYLMPRTQHWGEWEKRNRSLQTKIANDFSRGTNSYFTSFLGLCRRVWDKNSVRRICSVSCRYVLNWRWSCFEQRREKFISLEISRIVPESHWAGCISSISSIKFINVNMLNSWAFVNCVSNVKQFQLVKKCW